MRLFDADVLYIPSEEMNARMAVAYAPTVDAEPVRHGKWDDTSVAFYRKCTACGCCVEWDKKPFLFGDGEYNYCPNCGAKMDGGEDDDPCQSCAYAPPSSTDGKPCSFCDPDDPVANCYEERAVLTSDTKRNGLKGYA